MEMDTKEACKWQAFRLLGPCVLKKSDDEQSSPLRRKGATIVHICVSWLLME